MKYKKEIILKILLPVLIAGNFVISCKNDIETVNKLTNYEVLPTFVVEGLETEFSDSGKIKMKMKAPELLRIEDGVKRYDEYPKGFYVEFYDSKNRITGSLKCNYAKYLIEEEIWEAKRNVEVKNFEKNEKINTDRLFWDMKKEYIYSDKYVKITTPDEILFGMGFEANQDMSKWKIIKPSGIINIKDE